jgi:hypothetical protein
LIAPDALTLVAIDDPEDRDQLPSLPDPPHWTSRPFFLVKVGEERSFAQSWDAVMEGTTS